MISRLGQRFTDLYQRFMPDAFVFALILTLITSLAAYFWTGTSPIEILKAWYTGFWKLLEFGMQMVLLVITGYSIALSPFARKGIDRLGDNINTPRQVYFIVMLVGVLLCLVSWSWVVITAVLGRELALKVKGVNYPFLVACVYLSGGSWVTGLSSSIPLLLNTPENYMIKEAVLSDTISTSFTLGSSLNFWMVILFLIFTPLLMVYLSTRTGKIIEIQNLLTDKSASSEESIASEAADLRIPSDPISDKLDNSLILQWIIGLMGLTYIVYHFYTYGFELDLNIIIFSFLMLGLLLHGTPIRYVISMKRSSSNVSGILFQFPFYAGIMGIMSQTGLGGKFAEVMASLATIETYPFFAYVAGGIVNFAIPSAGGEFAVMGPSVIAAVNDIAAGLPPTEIVAVQARASMSMAYGESLTNLLQPFFLLLVIPIMGAGIKLQARDVMGYLVIPFILFFIIQSLMVTFMPI